MPEMSVTYKVIISLTIAVLKRGEVWRRVLGPMPYALCPMPYDYLMLLIKAILMRRSSRKNGSQAGQSTR
jgi:hypothetical protein